MLRSATQVYLVAKGGNPGLSGTVNNSSLAMMTALGSCGSIVAGAAVVINEVTTVASVAALSAFYSTGGNVGTSATNGGWTGQCIWDGESAGEL